MRVRTFNKVILLEVFKELGSNLGVIHACAYWQGAA